MNEYATLAKKKLQRDDDDARMHVGMMDNPKPYMLDDDCLGEPSRSARIYVKQVVIGRDVDGSGLWTGVGLGFDGIIEVNGSLKVTGLMLQFSSAAAMEKLEIPVRLQQGLSDLAHGWGKEIIITLYDEAPSITNYNGGWPVYR